VQALLYILIIQLLHDYFLDHICISFGFKSIIPVFELYSATVRRVTGECCKFQSCIFV